MSLTNEQKRSLQEMEAVKEAAFAMAKACKELSMSPFEIKDFLSIMATHAINGKLKM